LWVNASVGALEDTSSATLQKKKEKKPARPREAKKKGMFSC